MKIDLNCDLGEGFPNDEALMPLITSANIACGFHAGDAVIMKRTVESALRHGVAIGAHPGFDDRANFGRTEMTIPENELYDLLTRQIAELQKLCAAAGVEFHHVKPHGALYNMAARDLNMSMIIARAVKDCGVRILYALSGSKMTEAAGLLGLATASEVFADRSYRDDGSLTPRSQPGALIEDEAAALQQALRMAREKTVISTSGKSIPVTADTICLHGDGAHAVRFARAIRDALTQQDVRIEAC